MTENIPPLCFYFLSAPISLHKCPLFCFIFPPPVSIIRCTNKCMSFLFFGGKRSDWWEITVIIKVIYASSHQLCFLSFSFPPPYLTCKHILRLFAFVCIWSRINWNPENYRTLSLLYNSPADQLSNHPSFVS